MTTAVGVDVGKKNLDVSVSEGPVVRFDNTKPGITRLLKYLGKHDDTLVVCEATGGYERALVSRLREAGVAIHVAHPTRVRAFAKACGYEAKTDPRDAQVLSRYGQVFPDMKITEDEFDPEREELRDILNRRRQFVAQRVQELGRLDKGSSSITIRSTKRHIAWLEKEIDRLDREYRIALDRSVQLAERATLYRSVPGIGPLTAAILVAFLPELGHWDSKAITSLVGLAPWSPRQWEKKGQTHDPGRSGHSSVRAIPVRVVGYPARHGDAQLLPASA